MPYRIVYKSCSQWQGTELEGGDTGEEYETKEEAEAAMQDILDKPDNDIMQAAIEAQGVEGWLEIQEV
ncbi:MAG: hypothetical protein KGL39_56255 [Patescibacteria group bacterium]|nr:hypothetical protein [Patescibacteria group bacterium]